MKLLYYDQYIEQMISMPKHIQKKAMEFSKKFKQNSKSSAIHLEPISNFKDQRLRSARIDQTYRAIIRVPDSGDVYYMLWIDHHDKAYKWAENKSVDWNEETQTIQIISASEVINKVQKVEDNGGPFSNYKEKELLQIGVPEILLPSIVKIQDLDELDALANYIPDSLFENLFFLIDGARIDTLITEIEEGKSTGSNIDDQAASINNQRNFIELGEEDEILDKILNGDFTKWKYYLHPSQRKIVEYQSKGPIKVSGGAGTGKTVAAIHRLKNLTELENGGKTIFLSYTNALTSNLGEMLKDFDIESQKYDVSTIDSFVHKIAIKHGLIDKSTKIANRKGVKSERELWEEVFETNVYQYDLETVEKEYTDVILYHDIENTARYFRVSRIGMGKSLSRRQRNELWKIIQDFEAHLEKVNYIHDYALYNKVSRHLMANPDRSYQHCIVDELQDLSNIHLRFVRALIAEGPNDLFLVGDPLQNIYDRKLNFSKAGIHIRGKRSRRLKINYRTSEEIRKKAISIISGITFDDFDGNVEPQTDYLSLFHGLPPAVEMFDSKSKEHEKIVALIKEYAPATDEIERKLSTICITSRIKDDLKDIKKILHKLEIPYYDVKDKSGNKNGVHLSTFHSLKGLEYKHVILSSVNQRTCPLIPYGYEHWENSAKETHMHKERSLVYVVLTRSRETVDILGVGDKSEII